MDIPISVIEWCAKQVYQQQADATYVPRMIVGWRYAANSNFDLTRLQADITRIHNLVVGDKVGLYPNYRRTPVLVNNNPTIDWRLVNRAMNQLCSIRPVFPEDWCRQVLQIHPFVDGNGRTVAIIYNWMNRSLWNPVDLPEYQVV